VAALTGGLLASSRVQAHWDIELPDGDRMQRFLANPSDRWVNEHTVQRIPGVGWYVLVLFENAHVVGVLAFPNDLTAVCSQLGQRHPRQSEILRLTRRDWQRIRDHVDAFSGCFTCGHRFAEHR
jgi:hypothetical protein